jgi:hypothetical protein
MNHESGEDIDLDHDILKKEPKVTNPSNRKMVSTIVFFNGLVRLKTWPKQMRVPLKLFLSCSQLSNV